MSNPVEFAYKYSREFLQNCEPASKIISNYKNLLDKFNLSLKKMDNMKNDDGKNMNSDDKDKLKQSIMETNKPELKFYPSLQINSPQHLIKFAPHMKDKVDRRNLRHHYILEEIPLDAGVPDWMMQLLFAGVGIYAPNNNQLDRSYTEFVLRMTAEGMLAFLISDDTICYGANYPFAHVVIEEEMAHEHSIGTIFQLAGRAGRVGQSWVAYAHIGPETNKRIMDYIRGNQQSLMEEAVNIRNAFTNILQEIKVMEETKKQIQIQKQTTDKKIIKLSEVVPIEKQPVKNVHR
ncbi:replicative superfamily II helicase, partial [Klosneuvirus KNV1]